MDPQISSVLVVVYVVRNCALFPARVVIVRHCTDAHAVRMCVQIVIWVSVIASLAMFLGTALAIKAVEATAELKMCLLCSCSISQMCFFNISTTQEFIFSRFLGWAARVLQISSFSDANSNIINFVSDARLHLRNNA